MRGFVFTVSILIIGFLSGFSVAHLAYKPKIEEVHFAQWLDVTNSGWHFFYLNINKDGDLYFEVAPPVAQVSP